MKIKKGDAGYIRSRKIKTLIKTTIQFAIVIALLILGIVQTGDRMNWLTVVAILGCLPAAKTTVELIMLIPHHSIGKEMAAEIDLNTELLTRVYDMVFTSEKRIMPVECIVISGNTICGYAPKSKVELNVVAQHIKHYLNVNKFDKVSVKLFENYTAFATRAEGMNNIAAVDKGNTQELEERIRRVILNISL